MAKLIWVRADRQGSIPCGIIDPTAADARDVIQAARAELLAQCHDDDSREAIEHGTFEAIEE